MATHGSSERSLGLTSIRFRNYKGLSDFSIALRPMNILVGPNNAGKSTILGAIRILAEGLRKAVSRSPTWVRPPHSEPTHGYQLSAEDMPVSLENAHTDYSDEPTTIGFRLSNGSHLILDFPERGNCILRAQPLVRVPTSPSAFRRLFPFGIGVIPVLGPVEHEEPLLQRQTVLRNLNSHRASRHFRNYWYHFPDEFERFKTAIEDTWPGMSVRPPEVVAGDAGPQLIMFCDEQRMLRELFWVGSGFQVWCQLVTHIIRSSTSSLLAVDEPEIYLHPDLQRQFVRLVRTAGPDILMATHSSEVIAEADPGDICVIDKSGRSARRLKEAAQVQTVLDELGSAQNITLAQLARTRRVLFVEGSDYRLLRRFAERLSLYPVANAADVTAIPVGGFGHWKRLKEVAWGLEQTLGERMLLAAVFDRDYFCDEMLHEVTGELASSLELIHIHHRKELENYLLEPAVLDRVIAGKRRERSRRTGQPVPEVPPAAILLEAIVDRTKEDVRGQIVGRYTEYIRKTSPGTDHSTIATEGMKRFDRSWITLDTRLRVCPGKAVFAQFSEEVRSACGVGLTPLQVVNAMLPTEIAPDLAQFLSKLDMFRRTAVPRHG